MNSFELPSASMTAPPITTLAEAFLRIEALESQLLTLQRHSIPVPFYDDLTLLDVPSPAVSILEVVALRSHSLSGRMRCCLSEDFGCPRDECHTLLLLTWYVVDVPRRVSLL